MLSNFFAKLYVFEFMLNVPTCMSAFGDGSTNATDLLLSNISSLAFYVVMVPTFLANSKYESKHWIPVGIFFLAVNIILSSSFNLGYCFLSDDGVYSGKTPDVIIRLASIMEWITLMITLLILIRISVDTFFSSPSTNKHSRHSSNGANSSNSDGVDLTNDESAAEGDTSPLVSKSPTIELSDQSTMNSRKISLVNEKSSKSVTFYEPSQNPIVEFANRTSKNLYSIIFRQYGLGPFGWINLIPHRILLAIVVALYATILVGMLIYLIGIRILETSATQIQAGADYLSNNPEYETAANLLSNIAAALVAGIPALEIASAITLLAVLTCIYYTLLIAYHMHFIMIKEKDIVAMHSKVRETESGRKLKLPWFLSREYTGNDDETVFKKSFRNLGTLFRSFSSPRHSSVTPLSQANFSASNGGYGTQQQQEPEYQKFNRTPSLMRSSSSILEKSELPMNVGGYQAEDLHSSFYTENRGYSYRAKSLSVTELPSTASASLERPVVDLHSSIPPLSLSSEPLETPPQAQEMQEPQAVTTPLRDPAIETSEPSSPEVERMPYENSLLFKFTKLHFPDLTGPNAVGRPPIGYRKSGAIDPNCFWFVGSFHFLALFVVNVVLTQTLFLVAVTGLLFTLTYAPLRTYVATVVVASIGSAVANFCFRYFIMNKLLADNKRIYHPRLFLFIDVLYGMTVGIITGLTMAVIRMIAAIFWSILSCLRLDVPAFPPPFQLYDMGYFAYGSTVKTTYASGPPPQVEE
jgi:hypothetical protein